MCRSEKKEILHNGYFYDVTNFSHPGGNIISFFVNNGEDSTNTFRQFHHRSIAKSSLMLQSLPRRKAEPGGKESQEYLFQKCITCFIF